MGRLALYREWRPQRFAELVGQEHIIRALRNGLAAMRISHAYLFTGPRGTGKTTTAKIVAKALNCENGPGQEPCNHCPSCLEITKGSSLDVLEIDAASNRGIDEIRDLKEKVKFLPARGRFKVYIVDEVHMLTTEAFNALLKTLEEPPNHVVFILATTEPHKLPTTIISRCQRYDFRNLGPETVVKRLAEIAQQESIRVSGEALQMVARAASGSLRDALGILDQCAAYSEASIEVGDVLEVLGGVGDEVLGDLAEALARGDLTQALKIVEATACSGKDLRLFCQELAGYLRNLLFISVGVDEAVLGLLSSETGSRLNSLKGLFTVDRLVKAIGALCEAYAEMKWSGQQRLLFEVALVRIGRQEIDEPWSELSRRIEHLERLSGNRGESGAGEENRIFPAAKPDDCSKAINNPTIRVGEVAGGAGSSAVDSRKVPSNNGTGSQEESEKGPGSQLSLRAVQEQWPQVLETVRKKKVTTHAFLLAGELVAVDGGQLVIGFKPGCAFHKERLEQQSVVVEQALAAHFGREMKVRCRVLEAPGKETVKGTHHLVQAALDVFGEQVVKVKDE